MNALRELPNMRKPGNPTKEETATSFLLSRVPMAMRFIAHEETTVVLTQS